MRRLLLLALLAAASLGGCDAAVVAILALSDDDDGDDAAVVLGGGPPPPDTSYHVWIATVADASAEELALQNADGVPDPLVWTEVGQGTQSAVFDPSAAPGTFNAILLQAGDAQVYHFESIEVLDGPAEVVLATAAAPTYSGQIAGAGTIVGSPDGLAADTSAAAGTKSFLFTLYSVPIDRFRVNVWGAARSSGDVVWTSTWSDAGNETPGGAAADGAGVTYVTVSDAVGGNRDIRILRFDGTGAALPVVTVSAGVTAAEGSHSIAVHTDDTVYVASTVGAGDILVRKYGVGLAATDWSVTFNSSFGLDRVEANGMAVDTLGNAVVGGGAATLLNGIDPWMRKFASANGGTMWTQTPPALPVDSASTYWQSVALDGANEVYSAGDLTSTASGFVEIVSRRSAGSDGTALWSDLFGDNQAPVDLGRAVGVDDSGNVHVGGFVGTTTQGRNGVILKYIAGGFLTSFITVDDLNALNDEVLDVAVEGDGTVYAVGYEGVAGQGENLWIRKYDPVGSLAWKRTYDGGVGNDRGVAVVLTGGFVVVVGSRVEAGGETNIHVRRYVK